MAPALSLTLVHVGDSITYGQYLDPALRWTSLLERRLGEAFHDVELRSFNRGISGETTRLGLERFPTDVQDLRPDVATLQYGLNDCNCWQTDQGLPRVSERAFSANLAEMIERMRRFGASRVVLATNHRTLRRTTMPSGERYEDANERYSELIRTLASETGVELCDVRKAFEPFDDDELERLLLPYPDQLHLSEAGNQVYAEAISPYVERAVASVLDREPILER